MWKKAIVRAGSSMAVTGFISQITLLIVELTVKEKGFVPLVPSYAAHFDSLAVALSVYHILIGLIGAAFGGFSVVFDMERWSFLKQGIIHFLLTTAVWLPVSIFLWGLDMYPHTVLPLFISFAVTYGITWWMNYQRCRETIRKINEKLAVMQEEAE